MFYDKGVTAFEMLEASSIIAEWRQNDRDFQTLWWLMRHKKKYKMAQNECLKKKRGKRR